MKLAQKKMLKLYGTRWHYMFLATEAPDFHHYDPQSYECHARVYVLNKRNSCYWSDFSVDWFWPVNKNVDKISVARWAILLPNLSKTG